MSESERTMYASQDAKRFFWVPDAEALPAGAFVVRSLTGKRLEVDEGAIAAFEVAEERAKELTQEEMQRIARKAGNLLAGAASVLRDAAKKAAPPPPLAPKAETNIASALGVTEEQLRNDPKAVLESLGTVVQGFVSTLKDAMSDDPAQRDRAKERMEVLANVVRTETGADATPIERMPEKIRDFLADPALEARVREATDKLQKATDDLKAWNAEQEKE